jgi:wyosine [tRNA(Phe)-imidazoG37] synthetase (radical SAM superfamily)
MTGEQFLNSIRFLDNEIAALDYERVRMMDRRQELLDAAESWGGLSGVVVQHSPGSKTENLGLQLAALITPEQVAAKINAYQERINKKIDKLVDRKQRAMDTIDRIPEAQYRTLLTLRYIGSLQWSTVADLMGYNEHYVRLELRKFAIEAYERARA